MALQITEWSPDTCPCRVVYEWDDTVPESLRIHTLKMVVIKGAEHSALIDASIFTVLQEENRRKNLTLGICEEFGVPFNQDGTQLLVNWSFTPGRTLLVSFPVSANVSAMQKNNIQTACNVRLGPTLVQVS